MSDKLSLANELRIEPLGAMRARSIVESYLTAKKEHEDREQTLRDAFVRQQTDARRDHDRAQEIHERNFRISQQAFKQEAEKKRQLDSHFWTQQEARKEAFEKAQKERQQFFEKGESTARGRYAQEERQRDKRAPYHAADEDYRIASQFLRANPHHEERMRSGQPVQPPSVDSYSRVAHMNEYSTAGQWQTAAQDASKRNAEHEASQRQLLDKAESLKATDPKLAEIYTLEARQTDAAYQSDVWRDVARKEHIARGETADYQKHLNSSQEERAKADKIGEELGQKRAAYVADADSKLPQKTVEYVPDYAPDARQKQFAAKPSFQSSFKSRKEQGQEQAATGEQARQKAAPERLEQRSHNQQTAAFQSRLETYRARKAAEEMKPEERKMGMHL